MNQDSPPELNIEELVSSIWKEVFQVPVEPSTNFFDVGGDSMAAVKIATLLHTARGVDIPIMQVFETPQLDEFTTFVQKACAELAARTPRQYEVIQLTPKPS